MEGQHWMYYYIS